MKQNYRFFEWINRHAALVIGAVVLIALALGAAAPLVANTEDPNFDPSGEVFDLSARADETLTSESTIRSAAFIVEAADGGDVLTAASLREWQEASSRIRSDQKHASHLVTQFDPDIGSAIPGVLSIADLVSEQIPGGLATATDADVKAALATILNPTSPTSDLRFTLSERASLSGGIWTAPAFITEVSYDEASFETYIDSELWLRDVQDDFRTDAAHTTSIGIGIDFDQTFDEAIQASAPFIFLAVALIVLLIAVVHRSYWSAVLIATGLGLTMLAYNGVAALIGLKMGSLLLAFIVPIAMISFGVDFFIHGSGRVREMQVDHSMDRNRAYPAGMTAVFLAMLLAVSSSVAAFLSNASAGIEAIVQFGIGAAIALMLAYLILGLLTPKALVGIETIVGAGPIKGHSKALYRLAILPVAIIGGLAVALAAVMPQMGAAAVAVVIVLFVALPAGLTRRRNRRAVAKGHAVNAVVHGAAHGLTSAGSVVHGLAAWRRITIPVVLALGAVGLFTALQVESGFELRDFLSSDTSVVQSIDRYGEHFPSNGEGISSVYVEGDLTDPATLAALDEAIGMLDSSGADFGRLQDGQLIVAPHATDVVRMTMASPSAIESISARGVEVTDIDGDGLPDDRRQVTAVYDFVLANGIPTPDGGVAYEPDEVRGFLSHDGGSHQATALVVQIGSFTDGSIIVPAREALDNAAASLRQAAPHLETVGATGDVIANYESLEAFRNSMLVSLPIAILLTLIIAAALLRSVRYAIASVVPILFVVVGLYAFMAVAGYTINIVTATIAAIAVGVGIDFSTHFTARFREELENEPNRLAALRRTGEGTGGALVLSALTSVLGFAVMAFAPMPIFATFGVLTAVMIALALLSSLVVLPSVLMLLTHEVPATTEQTRVEERELQPVG